MGGWVLIPHSNELLPPLSNVRFLVLMQSGILPGYLTGFPAVAQRSHSL